MGLRMRKGGGTGVEHDGVDRLASHAELMVERAVQRLNAPLRGHVGRQEALIEFILAEEVTKQR